MSTDSVTVFVENTYLCGQESSSLQSVPLSIEGGADEAFWDAARDLAGDGHPCGKSEHALYEVTIVQAPGHPELVGESRSWEG